MPWFSNNKTLKNIEAAAWYLFLATLAWQARTILWQADWQFIEWRSMALYGTDLLIGVMLLLAVLQGWLKRSIFRRTDWLLLGLLAAAVLSLIKTDIVSLSVYQTMRLAEFMTLFIYVRSRALKEFDIDMSVAMFASGALAQAVLALAQYILQHDVGIRWMGETLLGTDMRGVAVFYDLAHIKILRAYGALPHPNVLAVYLMLASWALAWLYFRHGKKSQAIWVISAGLLVVAMYATFSRTMIFAWLMASAAIAIIVYRSWPQFRPALKKIVITIIAISTLFVATQWGRVAARLLISSDDESVQLRVRYNTDALRSGSGFLGAVNWTGVGIGNFSTWVGKNDSTLPLYQRQPAHNVFLLVYSELGVIGSAVWLAWLFMIARPLWRRRKPQDLILLVVFAACLFVALFDHFFWTLQQGRILWWLVLALL